MKHKIIKKESDWLSLRHKFVTASESASLLGLNKYSSAMSMWSEKQNRTFVGNSYTKIGQALESLVVTATNEVLGREFKLYEEAYKGKVFFYDDSIRLGATPDAFDRMGLLECKTTNPFTFLRYAGAPPTNYIMQIQTQMYCTEIDNAHLAILSTDLSQTMAPFKWPMVVYEVQRNEELLKLLKMELTRFWDCIDAKKQYRVTTAVKNKALLLSSMTHRRII